MRKPLCIAAAILLCGCARHGVVLDGTQGRVIDPHAIRWTEEEKSAVLALAEIRRGNWNSEHVARLNGAEPLHVHERHDLSVTLLSGRLDVQVGEDWFKMRPGDVLTVPHGTPHRAVNRAHDPSIAYVVFTPPFDGTDSVEVKP